MRYNREKAVKYAQSWALLRNPEYYNFDYLGGDCTNFVSQCIYAGLPEMNYSELGWYYFSANIKSPSWTGVNYLFDFLVSNNAEGPRGRLINENELDIGDIIQLSFDNNIFGHTLIVSETKNETILVCAHTIDSKNRPLETYSYEEIRLIKVY